MSECRNCGRETCPTLTMPKVGIPFLHFRQDPSEIYDKYFAWQKWRNADADCRNHTRDWYEEAQKLRAELNAMTDRATVYRMRCGMAREAADRGDLHGVREALGGEE